MTIIFFIQEYLFIKSKLGFQNYETLKNAYSHYRLHDANSFFYHSKKQQLNLHNITQKSDLATIEKTRLS